MLALAAVTGCAAPVIDVRDFGAKGDGVAADTRAIEAAIAAGVASARKVYLPAGTYRTVPATPSTNLAGPLLVSWPLRSGLHMVGDRGATIRLADDVSTDAAPQNVALFHTNGYASEVSFEGITFDMNGANNPISPGRPATYQTGFEMATISVSGTGAHADDVRVAHCTFMNTSGTNVIVTGESRVPGPLSRRWTFAGNTFLNNGLDTSDHSCVYAWAEDVRAIGNTFRSDTPYRSHGLAGMQTAYEIHGANQVFAGNRIVNAARGLYVASNVTAATTHAVVSGNVFETATRGVDFFRDAAGGPVSDTTISGNTFAFDDDLPGGGSGSGEVKVAVAIDDQYAVSNVLVQRNTATKRGSDVPSVFFWGLSRSNAGQGYANLRILDNHVTGFTDGVALRAQNSGARWGFAEVAGNAFFRIGRAGMSPGVGLYVEAAGTIAGLAVDRNRFASDAGATPAPYGVYLDGGTITELWLGEQFYEGGVSANPVTTIDVTIGRNVGPAAAPASRWDTSAIGPLDPR